jgi:hypothetical protein
MSLFWKKKEERGSISVGMCSDTKPSFVGLMFNLQTFHHLTISSRPGEEVFSNHTGPLRPREKAFYKGKLHPSSTNRKFRNPSAGSFKPATSGTLSAIRIPRAVSPSRLQAVKFSNHGPILYDQILVVSKLRCTVVRPRNRTIGLEDQLRGPCDPRHLHGHYPRSPR